MANQNGSTPTTGRPRTMRWQTRMSWRPMERRSPITIVQLLLRRPYPRTRLLLASRDYCQHDCTFGVKRGRRCVRRKPRVDDVSTVLVGADGVRPLILPPGRIARPRRSPLLADSSPSRAHTRADAVRPYPDAWRAASSPPARSGIRKTRHARCGTWDRSPFHTKRYCHAFLVDRRAHSSRN